MTTYFAKWKQNRSAPMPQDPKLVLQMSEAFLALLKQQIQSGVIKEAHTFLEGDEGYFVSGDVSDEKLHEAIVPWLPYVTFEFHRTIPLIRSIEMQLNIAKTRATLTIPA